MWEIDARVLKIVNNNNIVTHVNSKCNQGKTTTTIFKEQEEEKKRKYQQRVLDVEMGSFTPLVFDLLRFKVGTHMRKRFQDTLPQNSTRGFH